MSRPNTVASRVASLIALTLVGALATRARADGDAPPGAPVARRWSSPQPTGESLTAAWGTEAAAWAVGDAGTILRSTDHGATWTAVHGGTTRNLNAVWGSDEGDLWIAGDAGTVLHSHDGGLVWNRLPTPSDGDLHAIWGSDAHDVYLTGDGGQVLHTRDHGRSFTALPPLGDSDERLVGAWGGGADDLYVAGDRGSLRTTSDHGQHWTTLRAARAASDGGAGSAGAAAGGPVSIVGTGRGQLVGMFGDAGTSRKNQTAGAAPEHTQDGGKTWQEIRVEPTPSPASRYGAFHAAAERVVYGVTTFELWDRAVEERQRLGLIVSRDGGATFQRRSLLPRGPGVNALWRDPTGPLIAVGPAGTILRSRDDGRTWEEARAAHPFGTSTLRAIWTDGTSEIWIVGDACTVLHSSDGGARFEMQRPCPADASGDLQAVWGSSVDDIYVAGGLIARTVDRGQHWAVVTPPAPIVAPWRIWGSDADDLYAGGYGVWRSTDGAQTWRLVNGSRSRNRGDWFGPLFGVGNDRYAVTSLGRLERGTKAGAGWQAVAPPTATAGGCVYWADGTAAIYAFGGGNRTGSLLRSRDGGRSFQPLTTTPLNRATFITMHRRGDQLFLLAAVDEPPRSPTPALAPSTTLLRSGDDGATWTTYARLPAGATTLATIDGDLLVVGANGLVVRLR